MKAPLSVLLLAVTAISVGSLYGQSRPAAAELKFVAIVSRHGVRAPTWTPERLNEYSSSPWPEFGVAPGYLTPHGFTLITRLGHYYGDWLRQDKLLSGRGCDDAAHVYIWADTDQRTLETGRAFGQSLLSGCRVDVHSLPEGERDPLFDPLAAGLSSLVPAKAHAAIEEKLGDPVAFLEKRRGAFETLQAALSGSSDPSQKVFGPGAAIRVQRSPKGADLVGPLNVASTLTENLLLEYANGFTGAQFAWGRLDEAKLLEVLQLHGDYAGLTRETPYLAGKRGWNIAGHLLESMRQATTGQASPGALGPANDKVLIIAGHDTNISNLAGMFGLQWQLGSYQKNETPPGSALLFLLFREPSGEYRVRLRFVAQTLRQMNQGDAASALDPPALADVQLPGCGTAGCPWNQFEKLVRSAVANARN